MGAVAEMLPDLIARLRLDMSDMEQSVSRSAAIGGAIGGALGSVLSGALSAAFDKVRAFVDGSVEAFSELEDSTAAAGVVFGDSMGSIIEQSRGAAGALGLSQQAVINAANTFGTYGKSAGLAGSDLAKFSTDLTSLAGDMASFKGTSTEQAIEAIGAALRGEAEPIRAYGVLLDDATLRQEALAMGLINTTKDALTPQQKVLAAQAAIFKQTTDAQGDFARTADSTANVAKTLAAETDNLQAKFGSALAPAFTAARARSIEFVRDLSSVLDTAIPALQAFVERASGAIDGLRTLFTSGDITGGLLDSLGVEEDSPVIDMLLTLRETAAGVLNSLRPAFAAVGQMFTTLGPTFASLLPQVLGIAQAFSPLHLILTAITPVLPTLVTLIGTVVSTLATGIASVLPPILALAQTIAGLLTGALLQIVPLLVNVATMLAGVLADALGAVVPALVALAEVLGPVVGTILAAVLPIVQRLGALLQRLLPPILALIDPLVAMVNAFLPLVGVVGELIATILPPLIDLLFAVLEPVIDLIGVVAQALVPILNAAAQVIGTVLVPILTTFVQGLATAVAWIVSAVIPAVERMVSVLSAVITWVARAAAAVATWIAGLLTAGPAISRWVQSVADGVGRVVQWFRELPGRVLEAISSLAGRLVEAGRNVIEGFIRGIGSMAGRVISAIKSTITDALPSFVKSALGIASPSRVFRRLGEFTAMGFADGINAGASSVQRAADDMVSAVSGVNVAPPVMAPLSTAGAGVYGAAGASASAAPQQVPPINVRVYVGDTELRDVVRVEVNGRLVDEANAIVNGVTG